MRVVECKQQKAPRRTVDAAEAAERARRLAEQVLLMGVRRAWALAGRAGATRARCRAARATGERALTPGRGSLPAGPLIGGNRGCPDQPHARPQPRPVDACRRTGVDAGYFST